MPSLPSLDLCKTGEGVSRSLFSCQSPQETQLLMCCFSGSCNSSFVSVLMVSILFFLYLFIFYSSYPLSIPSILPARINNKCIPFFFSFVSLQCHVSEAPGQLSNVKEDVRYAACDLVCEWAQKVLKRQFDAVEDLARFLIDSHYISNRSLAALTITASTAAGMNQSP